MRIAIVLASLTAIVLVAIYFVLKARRRSDHGHGKEGCDGPDDDGNGSDGDGGGGD